MIRNGAMLYNGIEGIYRGRGEVMLLRAGIDNTSGSLFMIYDSWL